MNKTKIYSCNYKLNNQCKKNVANTKTGKKDVLIQLNGNMQKEHH